jgi:uncharacterized protein YutE (UPF0331/DUF86 family)
MADDIVLNKLEIIERCITRIHEEYTAESLRTNQTKQDSILLNLERACQAAIDMGMRICRLKRLGIPKESRDPFAMMHDHKLIDEALQNRMFGLVGFRNTAVHNYKKLDLNIVEVIIKKHLVDFQEFGKICMSIT